MLDRSHTRRSSWGHVCAIWLLLAAWNAAIAQDRPAIVSMSTQPGVVHEGDVVSFAVEAVHPEGAPMRYAWSFGDGSSLPPNPRNERASTVYLDQGTYEVRVEVEDASGATSSASTTISVANVAPRIVDVNAQQTPTQGSEVRFVARVHDPGNDTLSVSWDFGDGTILEAASGATNVNHVYEEPGRYTVRVVVDDGDGGTAERAIVIDVGAGLRYSLTGALRRPNVESESAYYAAASTVYREQGEAVFGEDPVCLVHFGGGDSTQPMTPDREPLVAFHGTFPLGLLEGATYPVLPERNEVVLHEPGEWLRQLHRNPDRFMVSVVGVGESGYAEFHGVGGSVDVERADAQRVELRFDIRLERSLSDTEVLETGQAHPPGEPLALGGRMVLDLDPDSAAGSLSVLARTGAFHLCRPAEAMHVVDVTTMDGSALPISRDGVVPLIDYEQASIDVRFSEPIDVDRAEDAFSLGWRHRDGSMRWLPVRVTLLDSKAVRITPLADLMDGVVYRLRIRGGGAGVLGVDGHILPEDEIRHVETLLDLSEHRNGIGVSVTQVSREAALVPNKPAETRIYVNWSEKPQVDPSWQTRWAEFDVRVSGDDEKRTRAALRRWDLYSPEELKHAVDAVRMFGWRPRGGGTAELTVRVAQTGPGAPGRPFETTWRGDVLGPVSALAVEYVFVRAGSWREAVPPGARERGAAIAFAGAAFSEQVFPTPSVTVRPGPDFLVAPPVGPTFDAGGYVWTIGSLFHHASRETAVARDFAEQLGGERGPADVVILFVPEDVLGASGQAQTALGNDPRIVVVSVDSGGTIDFRANTVAHEIGHAFGLEHGSGCATRDSAELQACIDAQHRDDIEGTRMDADGRDGSNKSVWSGNADLDRTPGYLFSFMHPLPIPVDGAFITKPDYAQLLRAFTAARPAPGLPHAHDGTADMLRVQDSRALGVRLRGWVDLDRGSAALWRVRDAVEPAPGESTRGEIAGDLLVVVQGVDGQELGQAVVEPVAPDPWHPPSGHGAGRAFSVFVPIEGDGPATRVQVRSGSRVLVERQASDSPPSVSVSVPEVDLERDSIVRWQAVDPDGEDLRFDVEYAPNGTDWVPIAIGIGENQLDLRTFALPPGDEPRLRIWALDGFHASFAEIAVEMDRGLRMLAVTPRPNETASPRTTVTVWTLGAIPEAMAEAIVVERADRPGVRVEGTVAILPRQRGLRFTPAQSLEPASEFRVTVDPNIFLHSRSRGELPTTWTFSTHEGRPVPARPQRNFDMPVDPPEDPGPGPTEDARTGEAAEGASDENLRDQRCGAFGFEVWGLFVAERTLEGVQIQTRDGTCHVEYEMDGSYLNLQAIVFRTVIPYLAHRPDTNRRPIVIEVESTASDTHPAFSGMLELHEGPPHRVTVILRAE